MGNKAKEDIRWYTIDFKDIDGVWKSSEEDFDTLKECVQAMNKSIWVGHSVQAVEHITTIRRVGPVKNFEFKKRANRHAIR